MIRRSFSLRHVAAAVLIASGATSAAQAQKAAAVAVAKRPACTTCGTLLAVNEVEVEGKPGYTGAVLGGLAGAALGAAAAFFAGAAFFAVAISISLVK